MTACLHLVQEGNLNELKTQLSPDTDHSTVVELFKSACHCGHIPIAEWMLNQFPITREEADDGEDGASWWAAHNNHPDMYNWLEMHL